MKLRYYQQDMIDKTIELWNAGVTNVLGQLSTGAGKTVILSTLVKQHQGYSLVMAHRTELVSQLSLTLAGFGIRHNIIAPKSTIREIVTTHHVAYQRGFYDHTAPCIVASVDTLIRLPTDTRWFKHVTLLITDESHHVLRDNKWGKSCALFPSARGFFPTATPVRADGRGLGRNSHGLMDELIVGVPMRQLIREGYLCDYKIYAPPNDIDLSGVNISAGGDFSPVPLRNAVHKSKITGDVVDHYLRFANGKRGVTFAVDIKAAAEIALEFKLSGVSAEVISSLTPPTQRQLIMKKFRNGEILQLVNVDILGEGVDVPAIEVVSMARPTQSYCTFTQQFGRALRPLPGKTHAIIIDHVNNYARHGLPDAPRAWTLEPKERRSRGQPDDIIPLKTCLKCLSVYTIFLRECPYCGHYQPPQQRSAPEFVDGDLTELDPDIIARLRGETEDLINKLPKYPVHVEPYVIRGIQNRHAEKIRIQTQLRAAIAQWAGILKHTGCSDSEIYRRFYYQFNIDILTAQTLGASEANVLYSKVVDSTGNSV